jgi:hypothetical protein
MQRGRKSDGRGGGGTKRSTLKEEVVTAGTPSTASAAIELLSDEILCVIFGFLDDGIDLCAVGQVNHFWHRLAQDDSYSTPFSFSFIFALFLFSSSLFRQTKFKYN